MNNNNNMELRRAITAACDAEEAFGLDELERYAAAERALSLEEVRPLISMLRECAWGERMSGIRSELTDDPAFAWAEGAD
jgi:hypothetical protein